MTMKRLLSVCIALVMMLSFIPAVHAEQAQNEVSPALMGEVEGSFNLTGSTDVAFTQGIGSTGDTLFSLYLPVAAGEKMIVSYEFYNSKTSKWEPSDVRIVHGPASGFVGTLKSDSGVGGYRVAVSTSDDGNRLGSYRAEFVAW